MRRAIYVLACVLLFGAGAYVWRIKNTGVTKVAIDERREQPANFQSSPIVVEVGPEKVFKEDIDWEYDLVTADVEDRATLTPIPNLGERYYEEMSSLRKALISSVIERKLLYLYVQQDRTFRYDDPSRYTACLSEWQETMKAGVRAVQVHGGRDRLKARLCERSILDQYMKERLFAKVQVGESEIVEYFKNHVNEFSRPEQVVVLHILLGSESEARKMRHKARAANFAELAAAHSLAPEAAKGGRLGPFAKGALPSVFDVAFQMRKGDISDVLKSNYGYHVIMVVQKLPKTDPSLDAARPIIEATLRKTKEEAEYRKLVDLALASISVTVPKATW